MSEDETIGEDLSGAEEVLEELSILPDVWPARRKFSELPK